MFNTIRSAVVICTALFCVPGISLANAQNQLLEKAEYWAAQYRDDLARSALEKLLASEPDHARALLLLGELEIRSSQPANCRDVVARLATHAPSTPQAKQLALHCRIATTDRIEMARIRRLAESGQSLLAAKAAARLFDGEAPSGDLGLEYYRLISADFARHREVEQGLRRLIRAFPDEGRYSLALADFLVGQVGRQKEVIALLRRYDDAELRAEALNKWRRELLSSAGRIDQRSEIKDYLKYKPDDIKILNLLKRRRTEEDKVRVVPTADYREIARHNESLGLLRNAETLLRAGLRNDPNNPWIRFDLARLLISLARTGEARSVVAEGVEKNPADEMRFVAALIYEKLDDSDAAARQLKAIPQQRQSDSMRALVARTQIESCLNRYSAASDAGQQQLASKMLAECEYVALGDASFSRRLALAWLSSSQDERAISLVERHAAAYPSIDAQLTKAAVLTESGHIDASSVALRSLQMDQLSTQQLEVHQAITAKIADLKASKQRDTWRYQQLAGGVDGVDKPGSAGRSQLRRFTVPVQLHSFGNAGIDWTMQADLVDLNAGRLPADYDEAGEFGQVAAAGPQSIDAFPGGIQQSATGVAVGFQFRSRNWQGDLGTTPIGFAVEDLVGGLSYRSDWGEASYRVELSRRPITSTLLSYAGATDPVSGRVWGGVRETGIRSRIARDWERWDAFASAAWMYQSGKNVQDNRFAELRAGADYALITQVNSLLYLGTTLTWWQHSENLRYYSFGQGGYYSPQRRLSLNVPIDFRHRWARWSVQLRAAASYSDVFESDSLFYPTEPGLQEQASGQELPSGYSEPEYEGGNGGGFGYSLFAAAEYQLRRPWVVGLRFDVDRSAFYEPNFFALYFRRNFGGVKENVRVPAKPPSVYASY